MNNLKDGPLSPNIVAGPKGPPVILLVHTEEQAAKLLGLSARTLQRLRLDGEGPIYAQLTDRRVGYTEAALRSWLDQRQVTSTSGGVDRKRGGRAA